MSRFFSLAVVWSYYSIACRLFGGEEKPERIDAFMGELVLLPIRRPVPDNLLGEPSLLIFSLERSLSAKYT